MSMYSYFGGDFEGFGDTYYCFGETDWGNMSVGASAWISLIVELN